MKEKILEWLKENPRTGTPYSASVKFNISIEEFYNIMRGE